MYTCKLVETSQGSGHRCSFAGSEDVIKKTLMCQYFLSLVKQIMIMITPLQFCVIMTKMCYRLQSITITIVISSNPDNEYLYIHCDCVRMLYVGFLEHQKVKVLCVCHLTIRSFIPADSFPWGLLLNLNFYYNCLQNDLHYVYSLKTSLCSYCISVVVHFHAGNMYIHVYIFL